jgi:diamine N-acetyltransferase
MLENQTHRLRAVEPTDAVQLYRIENKSDEWWLGSNLAPFSRATLEHYTAGKHDLWSDLQLRMMIEAKGNTSLSVGAVDLYQLDPRNRRAGVGIVIEEEERRNGHGLSALNLLSEYAFGHLGLHQIWAEVPASNGESLDLFNRAGFEKKGTLSDWVWHGSDYHDAHWMQKIAGQ